jgi:hypothetical protein
MGGQVEGVSVIPVRMQRFLTTLLVITLILCWS